MEPELCSEMSNNGLPLILLHIRGHSYAEVGEIEGTVSHYIKGLIAY